jgi:hypothetical protein
MLVWRCLNQEVLMSFKKVLQRIAEEAPEEEVRENKKRKVSPEEQRQINKESAESLLKDFLQDCLDNKPPDSEEVVEEKAQELFRKLKGQCVERAEQGKRTLCYSGRLTDRRIMARVEELFEDLDKNETNEDNRIDCQLSGTNSWFGDITVPTSALYIDWR